MCFLGLLSFALFPRVLIIGWWLADLYRFLAPFNGMLLVPILGTFLLPWTTLAYILVWRPSSSPWGPDLVWLAGALAIDVAQYVATYYNILRIEGVASQFHLPKQ